MCGTGTKVKRMGKRRKIECLSHKFMFHLKVMLLSRNKTKIESIGRAIVFFTALILSSINSLIELPFLTFPEFSKCSLHSTYSISSCGTNSLLPMKHIRCQQRMTARIDLIAHTIFSSMEFFSALFSYGWIALFGFYRDESQAELIGFSFVLSTDDIVICCTSKTPAKVLEPAHDFYSLLTRSSLRSSIIYWPVDDLTPRNILEGIEIEFIRAKIHRASPQTILPSG